MPAKLIFKISYAQIEIVVKFSICFSKTFGLKNLGLLLEFRSLVGIGRSGIMIGRLCLKMVKNAWCGAEL